MTPILIYFLKSAISLALFYTFYWFFLRKETFFHFNRYYFLGSIAFSFLLPLINLGQILPGGETVPVRAITESYATFQDIVITPVITTPPVEQTHFLNVTNYIFILYICGALLLLIRMLMQVTVLSLRIKTANPIEILGIKVVVHKKVKSPFSFFNYVFINPDQLKEENVKEVLLHEKEHINQKHSIDLLIAELMTTLQWFNPFVWLIKRSLIETHEYLVDSAVLKQGVSVDEYQRTLISFMLGAGNPALITPLNFSLNKKRLIMMNKIKSPAIRKWRGILLLPIILLLTLAFSNPSALNKNIISKQSAQPFKDNAKPESDNKYVIKGIVTDIESGNPIPGVSVLDRDKMTGTITDTQGRYTLQIDNKRSSIIFIADKYKMLIKGTGAGEDVDVELQKKDDSQKPALILLYGKEITQLESMNIPYGTIKKFDKIDPENAVKEYGEKGRNGVTKIILKDDCIQLKEMDLSKPIPRRIMIDGNELTKSEFIDLPHKKNYKFEVINGDNAVSKYGESARFGIFVGTSTPNPEKQIFAGKIIDKTTKEPIPGVSIILAEKHIGTISDTQGRFEILADSREIQLSFSYLNYGSVSVTLESSDKIVIELQKVANNEYKISGKVIDDNTRKPIPGVSIVVYGTTTGTVTDVDGRFSLITSENPVKVSFSFVGYESVVTNISSEEKPVIRLKKTILVISFDNIPVPTEPTQPQIVVNKNKPIFFVVESLPEYPGGEQALHNYIETNTNYPKKAKKQKITGTVYVNFTVDKDGNVTDIYIDKNKTVNPLLNKEAVRVVSEMPDWKPGEQRGKKVPVQMSVPVKFKLK